MGKEEKKDYCTLFFDKINNYDIGFCCQIHDDEYENPDITREEADENLRC